MGLIRLLIYGGLLWLLYRLIKSLAGATGKGRAQAAGRRDTAAASLDGGELVQDPSCGVYIPKATAVSGPEGLYFCSERCRDAYGRNRES